MSEIGPKKISFPMFLLKILAGCSGGVVGTLILLVIYILAASFIPSVESIGSGESVSPIFVFILMMMIFLASTTGNILSTYLLALTEGERYKRKASAIYQVFIASVIIFLLMVPVYFISASIDLGVTGYAVALHIILTAQISALILEIVSNYKYSLVGLYGVTFSIVISAAVLFLLAGVLQNAAILLFVALPIVWGSIAFTQSITTMIYGWIASVYDKDFLCTQTIYGDDYGKEVTEEEEPKADDEEGADFLRHN